MGGEQRRKYRGKGQSIAHDSFPHFLFFNHRRRNIKEDSHVRGTVFADGGQMSSQALGDRVHILTHSQKWVALLVT